MIPPDWKRLASLYRLKRRRWDRTVAESICSTVDDVISIENPFGERCSDFIEIANLLTRLVALRNGFQFGRPPTCAAMSDVLATVPGIARGTLMELLDKADRVSNYDDDETPAFNLVSIDSAAYRLRSIVAGWFQSTPGPKLDGALLEWL